MLKKIKKKLLFTPGPLNTSELTKKSTLIDLGSRDKDFIEINESLFSNILKLGHAIKGYICLPIQGSGTFCLEAIFETLLSNKSKILILTNGTYGNRLINICKKNRKKFLVLKFIENEVISIDKIKKILSKNLS